MKILFVNEKCGYFGGVEQNVVDSARGLRARGHDCFLAYGEETTKKVVDYRSAFNETYCTNEISQGSSRQKFSFQNVIRQVEPNVIYFHKVPTLQFIEKVKQLPRTVRMVHDHDLCCPRRHKYFALSGTVCNFPAGFRCYLDLAFLERRPNSKLQFGVVSVSKKIREITRNHKLDAFLVGSDFMKHELLMNKFPKDKVHILPPVVKVDVSVATEVPEEPNILFVGQLIRGKGVDILLRALTKMPCKYKVKIVGTGNAHDKLEELAQHLDLTDKVKFEGWVDNNMLGSYYQWAKVVVVPSRWPEPFGMIGLEAMRYGRPVVGFNVGGIPDWLEQDNTGFLAREQNTTALAWDIGRILTDTHLARQFGRNALKSVQEKFSFDWYLDELERYLSGDNSSIKGSE